MLLVGVIWTSGRAAAVSQGQHSPPLRLPYLDGRGAFDLASSPRAATILYFWTPLSESRAIADLRQLGDASDGLGGAGIRVLAVVAFAEDTLPARALVRDSGIRLSMLVADTATRRAFTDGKLPTVVVLDTLRRVAYVRYEQVNIDSVMRLAEALVRKPPPPPPPFSVPVLPPRHERRTPSPFLYGLAGIGMNAVVPGLAGVFDKGHTEANYCLGASTLTFYVVGLVSLLDMTCKPSDLLTPEDRQEWDRNARKDLYAVGIAYVLNLVSGYIVGASHAGR